MGREGRPAASAKVVFGLVMGMVIAAGCAAGASETVSPPAAPSSPPVQTDGSLAEPTATPASPASAASFAPIAADGPIGVPTDEPCTTLAASIAELPSITLHHDDLERMVPERTEIKGLEAFTEDYSNWGYIDNAEVGWIAPNPPSTCDDTARFGRIEGYATSWMPPDGMGRSTMFVVHLFATEEGAGAWSTAFRDGLAAGARQAGSGYTFTEADPLSGALGIDVFTHTGGDGTRTWAMAQAGDVVAWVVDLHPTGEDGSIDVRDAAARMIARINAGRTEAEDRGRTGLDAAQLLAGPLPLAEYGGIGAGLTWDPFFGGCQDTVERGLIAGEQAAALARQLGRVTGCVAMYAPSEPAPNVVRLFSSVTVYRDADGARAAIEAMTTDYQGRGGRTFPVEGLGDTATGLVTQFTEGDGGQPFTDTRVAFATGEYAAFVAMDTRPGAPESDLQTLARRLEQRLTAVLALD